VFIIGIKHSLRDRKVDSPYFEELGLPTYSPDPETGDPVQDPIPTYARWCLDNGYWQYIADVNEEETDYSLYWTLKHGKMATGGFGEAVYTRCFNSTNPSAIVMTGDDYRNEYDDTFVDPEGGESLYAVFEATDASGQTAGHPYYDLLPVDIAAACSISPNRTWAWVMSRPAAGNRLGASSRLSTADYSSVILQIKQIPNARNGCAIAMMEQFIAGSISGVTMANADEARTLVNEPSFDI